jgi:ABC-type dipeptide/oligopeptide/nickel transport system permease subunit
MSVENQVENIHLTATIRGGEPTPGFEAGSRSTARRAGFRQLGIVSVASGVIAALLIILGLIGPWLTPHTISETVGPSFQKPSGDAWLGTDFLGRDVLSRVLAGGRNLVWLAFMATGVVTIVGAIVGLIAGYSKGIVGALLMRLCDILLILPAILILLVLATGYGGGNGVLIVSLVLSASPFLARVTRAATLEVVGRGYVEAAVARGERTWWVLARELLPNVSSVIVAYVGLLFVGAVYLSAAASFLGISARPPAADWGRMIQENMAGAQLEPWGVAVPAALLVVLAVTVNLFADGLQRRFASGSVLRGREE